jgi:hypothetical protein
MRAALIECTISEYEKFCGKVPEYADDRDVDDWACEVLRIVAESLGCAFAVIGAHGARVINAGSAIDPLLAGALVGNNVVQLFTVYSQSRPSMNTLSRRLLSIHQTKMNKGHMLSGLRTQLPVENVFQRYIPVNFDMEQNFGTWLVNLEAVLLTGNQDCVTKLLLFYEPKGAMNHSATMNMHTTDIIELAKTYCQLHSCSVVLVTVSDCGCFLHRQRFWPRLKQAFSEVAWLCRSGHVQPLQSRRYFPPSAYHPKISMDEPRIIERWQGRFTEPGFVTRMKAYRHEETMQRVSEITPSELGGTFKDDQKLQRLSHEQEAYFHSTRSGIFSSLRTEFVRRAMRYAFNGYGVIMASEGEECYRIHNSHVDFKGFVALRDQAGKIHRLYVGGERRKIRESALTECTLGHGMNARQVISLPETTYGLKKHKGIPMRAAGLYLLYSDPYYFAYLPRVTVIGKFHVENMAGLTAKGISDYWKGILAPRLTKGQDARLKRASHEFRRKYRLSRPSHIMIDGEIIHARTPSTLGSY